MSKNNYEQIPGLAKYLPVEPVKVRKSRNVKKGFSNGVISISPNTFIGGVSARECKKLWKNIDNILNV